MTTKPKGVMIKGMDMPKSCYDCPLFNREHLSCNIIGYDDDVSVLSRSKNCPLREVR